MKKPKLYLKKETLAALGDRDLVKVAGARLDGITVGALCVIPDLRSHNCTYTCDDCCSNGCSGYCVAPCFTYQCTAGGV